MGWVNLKDFDNDPSLRMIADYSRIKFSDPEMSTKVVRWAFFRYSPDVTLVGDNLDLEAAKSAGLASDAGLMELVQYIPEEGHAPRVQPQVQAVAIDVMLAMGGAEFRRWLVGREHLVKCYAEVLAPMVETDEDKRAVVLLKRGELFEKVGAIETSLDKLGENLFKKGDSDSIEHLAKYVTPEGTARSAFGSEDDDD